MPAAALPSIGAPSDSLGSTNAKTCDASGMAEIHRMFKAGFGEGPALITGVAEGEPAHAEVVGDHLAMLSTGLHAHQAQHAELLVHLAALDAALPAWRASGAASDAGTVLTALDGINAALAEHLPDEEQNIVPVMETAITQREVDALSDHGRRATPKGRQFLQLGAILAAQPDGGDQWMRTHLPAPVRLIWKVIGRPKYEANRRELTGGVRRT